jgi:hypothetical protein
MLRRRLQEMFLNPHLWFLEPTKFAAIDEPARPKFDFFAMPGGSVDPLAKRFSVLPSYNFHHRLQSLLDDSAGWPAPAIQKDSKSACRNAFGRG